MYSEEKLMECKEEIPGTSNSRQNNLADRILCEQCAECFQTVAALLSHKKWKHESPISCNYVCDLCNKVFKRQFNLDRHIKSIHNKPENLIRNNTCYCYFCDFKSISRKVILRHYEVSHEIDITKKTLYFTSFEEFQIWKNSFEKDTRSHFIRRNSTQHKRKPAGIFESSVVNYICHRDGRFQSKGKGIRNLKLVGSNKINTHCPANIVVFTKNQDVKVVYMDTHVGHELDLCHLHLSKSERAQIAEKLAMKIPVETILDDIRDSIVDSKLDRIHLLTRKDLWNIANCYNLNHKTIKSIDTADNNSEVGNNNDDELENEEDAILNVLARPKQSCRQRSLDERKRDMISKFAQWCDVIENEEQFEYVVVAVESIIEALSKKHNVTIPKSSKIPVIKRIQRQLRVSSTKRKIQLRRVKYVNPSNKEKRDHALDMVG